jgi:predicted nuclease of restriction endonuclease-like (RecB) superfamily
MNFEKLVSSIQTTSATLQQNAVKSVNIHLTLRNWLVGLYIVEYEQNGEDRAKYGQLLLSSLASKINIKGLSETNLKLCRQFYIIYPEILETPTPEYQTLIPVSIRQTLSDKLKWTDNDEDRIRQTVSDEFESTKNSKYLQRLLLSCSFSHIVELIKLDEETKRKFYELLIIKTTPSVRELQRQINTLTYERLGFSPNKVLALEQIWNKITPEQSTDLIKSHYFFEFLNLNHPNVIEESELEQELISHLQEFILELGNGFCFEARQKRILIGDEYFFIDLVFYHRILKCHVLVELKTEKANHEHIGQLKTYINYYKKNFTLTNDNPPVGILLATSQNKTLVEYAIADSDKDIFVSQYLLQLPDKEKLVNFINEEIKNLEH